MSSGDKTFDIGSVFRESAADGSRKTTLDLAPDFGTRIVLVQDCWTRLDLAPYFARRLVVALDFETCFRARFWDNACSGGRFWDVLFLR